MVCTDAADIETSNWLRWINCSRYKHEENVQAFKCYGKVYFQTVKNIVPEQELMVYYGDSYAQALGIDTSQFA